MSPNDSRLLVINLGLIGYSASARLVNNLFELRRSGKIPDLVLLLEHFDVVTRGKSASPISDLDLSRLKNADIDFHLVDRGGGDTYHGPGQLVVYPIIHLDRERSIAGFVRQLEEIMINTLGHFKIEGVRNPGYPGVWAGNQKLGSIGVSVRKHITYHGFALNVNTDLSRFHFINPCGMHWSVMTSIAKVLGCEIDMNEVVEAVIRELGIVFSAETEVYDGTGFAQAFLGEDPGSGRGCTDRTGESLGVS